MTLTLNKAWFADRSPGRGLITTATSTSQSTTGRGKFYFEAQLISALNFSQPMVGIGGSTWQLNNPIDVAVNGTNATQAQGVIASFKVPADNTSLGWGNPSRFTGQAATNYSANDWVGVAVDTINSLIWMRNASTAGLWTGDGTAGTPNPATGVKGFSFTTQITGDIYIVCGASEQGGVFCSAKLNVGASAFAASPPTGFTAWDGTGTTTLSITDKAAGVTLSGGNLSWTVGVLTPGAGQTVGSATARSTTHKTR